MSTDITEPVDPGAPSIVTSWLRTAIPGLWAALIAWLLTAWPWLAGVLDEIHVDLTSPTVVAIVGALALAVWYAAWRKLEPRLPDWLKRLVLGGAKAPAYAPVVAGVAQITTLPVVPQPQLPADDDPPKHAA